MGQVPWGRGWDWCWVLQGVDWVLWGVELVVSGDLTGRWSGCNGTEVGRMLGQGLATWDQAGAAGDGNAQTPIAPHHCPHQYCHPVPPASCHHLAATSATRLILASTGITLDELLACKQQG